MEIDKIWCWLNHLTKDPTTYELHAYEDDDPTKPAINGFRIVDGVVMRSGTSQDDPITVVTRGNVCHINGSLDFNGNMPAAYSTTTTPWSYLEQGCAPLSTADGTLWGGNGICPNMPLIWEIQFKSCSVGFSDFFGEAELHQSWNGDFKCEAFLYKKGDWVPTDERVQVRSYKFDPSNKDMLLLQIRLQSTRVPLGPVTPTGNIDILACPDQWQC